jgi:3-phenylpropionate/trans-cinnamate dioxygenase ferredoxin subunit
VTETTVLTVCRLDELDEDSAKRVDVDGHRLAVVRLGDDVYVIGDRCSHADYSLAEGELDRGDKTLECWKHGSTFSLETGEPTCLPAIKPVPTYEVSIVDGEIRVVVQ